MNRGSLRPGSFKLERVDPGVSGIFSSWMHVTIAYFWCSVFFLFLLKFLKARSMGALVFVSFLSILLSASCDADEMCSLFHRRFMILPSSVQDERSPFIDIPVLI